MKRKGIEIQIELYSERTSPEQEDRNKLERWITFLEKMEKEHNCYCTLIKLTPFNSNNSIGTTLVEKKHI